MEEAGRFHAAIEQSAQRSDRGGGNKGKLPLAQMTCG
jgi:hypothetical protein